MKIEIAHQDVAARAFLLYEASGCPDGHDMQHWLQAEEELKNEQRTRHDERADAECIPAVKQLARVGL